MRVADESTDARWLTAAIAVRVVFNATSVGLVTVTRTDEDVALWLFVTAFIGLTGILDLGFTPFAIRHLRAGAPSAGGTRRDIGRLSRRYAPLGVVGSAVLVGVALWSGRPLAAGPQAVLALGVGATLVPLTVLNRVGDALARGVDRVGDSARIEVGTYAVLTIVLSLALVAGAPIWLAVALYAGAILVSAARRWTLAIAGAGAIVATPAATRAHQDRETYTPTAAARWAVVTMSTQVVVGGVTIVAPRLLDVAQVAALFLLLRLVVILADVSSTPLQAALPRVASAGSTDPHDEVVRAVLRRVAAGSVVLLAAVWLAPASLVAGDGLLVTTTLLVLAWFVNRRNYAVSLLQLIGVGRSPWLIYSSGLLAYTSVLAALLLLQPRSDRTAWWIVGAHLAMELGVWSALHLASRRSGPGAPRPARPARTAGGGSWG